MFYKKNSIADEIEKSFIENLPKEDGGIQVALESLANSADLFEEAGLPDEAEVITQFMETIASGQFALVKEAKKKAKSKKKKSKKKTKASPKKKVMKTNEFSKDLTPEKELSNLLEVGWVFNAPSAGCGNCGNCMDCRDDGQVEEYKPDFELESHFPQIEKKE